LSCAYLGVDSAIVAALPVLVYYFGLGDSTLRRRVVIGLVVTGYAGVALLTATRVLPVEGLAFATRPEIRHDYVHTLIMSASVVQTRPPAAGPGGRTRIPTLVAMQALESARRGIRRRDALLQEANANLDRAIEDARIGRFTGRT